MSNTAEIILLYEKAKWASLIGLGYLAAKNPKVAASIAWRIGSRVIINNLKDTAYAAKVVWQELVRPEVIQRSGEASAVGRMHWADIVARGPIFGTTLILTVGGGIAQIFAQAAEVLFPHNPLLDGESPAEFH
jgi:hypothetical protein